MLLNTTNQKNVYYCINSIGTLNPPRASAWGFFMGCFWNDFITAWALSRPAVFLSFGTQPVCGPKGLYARGSQL